MDFNADTYNFLMNVMGAYFQAMGAVRSKLDEQPPAPPPLLAVRGGYAESPAWYMIQAAEFDPKPINVKNLRVRDIYASKQLAAALLEMLASEKWLDRQGTDYYLTDAGRQIITGMQQRPHTYLAGLTPLTDEDIGRLEGFLRHVIDSSLTCPNPPGSWCLAHSRNRAPDDSSAPLIKIMHYLADFNAFRDDAHMAAFIPVEPTGYIWESFTLIADGRANSVADLFETLAYRGYAKEDFARAVQNLQEKGWIEQDQPTDSYRVTDTGSKIRAEVEELTDRYFYEPWKLALKSGEIDECYGLLKRLQEGLQNIT